MKLVAGLGNPGAAYEGTPHNVGFAAVDALAGQTGAAFRGSLRFRAELARCSLAGEPMTLMKPQTFMNASGEAVGAWLRYYRVPVSEIVVVHDDVDLEPGRIRIRPKGSSGGHNGLASIIQHAGSDAFVRVRLGVGRGRGNRDMVAHVLGPVEAAHRECIAAMVARAAQAVEDIIRLGVDRAMSRHNAVVAADEA